MSNASCILTVVKNEHEYLDEWIQYHLDLGVGRIFIYEDTDSDSHSEICARYGERVSLDSVLSLMDEDGMKEAEEVKQTHRYNVQHIYLKNGLKRIKEKFSGVYDWCFVIDNDEFITLEDGNASIDDVLLLYRDYDAFVMRWKCYGANGLVDKPDYADKGVVETYTREMAGMVPDVTDSLYKTCYQISRFDPVFFRNQHHPNDKCDWCSTGFARDMSRPCYKNIYVRHYITKSWEEYVWKRKTRGFPWGGTRNLDFFFSVNPDMRHLKKELVKDATRETLVVMPYKQSGSQGNEIRIMLKAWRKFCQFEYIFVVIGEFSASLVNEFPWVTFLPCKSVLRSDTQYTPHLDIQNKFRAVSRKYSQVYDGFIYVTDDEYAVKPFGLEDLTKVRYHSSEFTGCEKSPVSFWNHDKWKTRQLLDREGLPHVNYTTHCPCWFEFRKMDEIRRRYNLLEESYVFDDVYFNRYRHEEPELDSEFRLGIWNRRIYREEFQKAVEDPKIKFICNSVEGWSRDLERDLERLVGD